MANVYVLGSLNMDTTYYVDRLPGEGETITSVSSQSAAGGKGLNQSAAAAWTGAATEIIGEGFETLNMTATIHDDDDVED